MTHLGDLPELRNSRCLRYRFRYSQCSDCVDACPAGALIPGEEGVILKTPRCSGCGLCVPACSVSVFRQPSFPVAALAKPAGKALTLACKPSDLEADLRIPCLGDLEPALLASLAMRNLAVTLRGSGHCAECHHAPQGRERLALLLDGMEAVEEAKPAQWCTPLLDEDEAESAYRADRRQLFRRFSNRAMESFRSGNIEEEETPESAIRAAAHYVPPRRELAERIMERLDGAKSDSPLPAIFRLATLEAVDGRCTGCEACARVCPCGALKTEEVDSRWALRFRAAQCVGCGVCIEACGAEALQLKWRWTPEKESDSGPLHELGRYRCESCGRFFIGLQEERCPVCLDDEDNFDAIFG